MGFVANDFLNWGAPVGSGGLGEAISPGAQNLGTSVDVTSTGNNQFEVSSNVTLERADNTTYAWDSAMSKWVSPTMANFGENINTFNGHFDAPSCVSQPKCLTSVPPYGPGNYPYQFGDPLLGAVGTTDPVLTFAFSHLVEGVAFEISAKTQASFIASLAAYDSQGNLLGVYQINTNSGGGICSGLNSQFNPTPCNDAPLIQFYDPEARIASVVLTANDPNGLFVDQVELFSTSTLSGLGSTDAPDPATATLIGVGLVVLAIGGRRLTRRHARPEAAVS